MIKNIAVLALISSTQAILISTPDKPKLTEPSNPFSEGQVVKREWNRLGNYPSLA